MEIILSMLKYLAQSLEQLTLKNTGGIWMWITLQWEKTKGSLEMITKKKKKEMITIFQK